MQNVDLSLSSLVLESICFSTNHVQPEKDQKRGNTRMTQYLEERGSMCCNGGDSDVLGGKNAKCHRKRMQDLTGQEKNCAGHIDSKSPWRYSATNNTAWEGRIF